MEVDRKGREIWNFYSGFVFESENKGIFIDMERGI